MGILCWCIQFVDLPAGPFIHYIICLCTFFMLSKTHLRNYNTLVPLGFHCVTTRITHVEDVLTVKKKNVFPIS